MDSKLVLMQNQLYEDRCSGEAIKKLESETLGNESVVGVGLSAPWRVQVFCFVFFFLDFFSREMVVKTMGMKDCMKH